MAQAQTEAKPIVSKNQALGWLRQMLLIRRFEERSAMLYQNQKIGGFCHLYSGQEAVAVGSIGALHEDDYVITAYRDHGHAIARGMEPKAAHGRACSARAAGCSKRQGRVDALLRRREGLPRWSRHRRQPPIPLAAGRRLRVSKYRGDQSRHASATSATVRWTRGRLHETFNIASLWKLPVIYVVENNMHVDGHSPPSPLLD